MTRVCVWCEKEPPEGTYGLGQACPRCGKAPLVLKDVPAELTNVIPMNAQTFDDPKWPITFGESRG